MVWVCVCCPHPLPSVPHFSKLPAKKLKSSISTADYEQLLGSGYGHLSLQMVEVPFVGMCIVELKGELLNQKEL